MLGEMRLIVTHLAGLYNQAPSVPGIPEIIRFCNSLFTIIDEGRDASPSSTFISIYDVDVELGPRAF